MALSSCAPFRYSSLPTQTSIRVLQVLPSIPGEQQLLKFAIKVIEIDNDNSYDCLSYTWGIPFSELSSYEMDEVDSLCPGNENQTVEGNQQCLTTGVVAKKEDSVFRVVIIDGEAVEHYTEIHENLRDALLQLSRGDAVSSPLSPSPEEQLRLQKYIWIDAICIDQSNKVERAQQVSIMNEIYSKAKRVVVWLGKYDLPAFTLFKNLATLSSIGVARQPGDIPADLEDPRLYEILGIQPFSIEEWFEIATFLQRNWFGRVWIVQETLAAQSISVLCGSNVLSWTKLTLVSRILYDTGVDRLVMTAVAEAAHVTPDLRKHDGYVENKIRNQYILAKMKEDRAKLKIHEICSYARSFLAGEVRDVVFALIGLWNRPAHHQEVYSLKPNYDKSVAEIFTAVSWAIIQEQQDLTILALVEDESFREQKSLPSWVPDWSVPFYARPLREEDSPLDLGCNWDADEGFHFPNPLTSDPDCLLVDGIRLSNVVEFAGTRAEIDDDFSLKTLLTLYASLPSEYPSGCTSIDAFCRTLVKDAAYDPSAAYHHGFGLLVTRWIAEMETEIQKLEGEIHESGIGDETLQETNLRCRDIKEKYSITRALIEKLAPENTTDGLVPSWHTIARTIAEWQADTTEEKIPDMIVLEQYQERFYTAYGGRRLFRTSDNHIGLAPRSVKHDDEVWVLAGSRVPIILRSIPSDMSRSGGLCRHVVGGAYVHGIMYGELPKRSDSRIERFLLR